MPEKLPGEPNTANQSYFDSALRHQVGVRRMSTTESNILVGTTLALIDRDFIIELRSQLARAQGAPLRSTLAKDLLKWADLRRKEDIEKLKRDTFAVIVALAMGEVAFERKLLEAAIPVDIPITGVSDAKAATASFNRVFASGTNQSRNYDQWFESLSATDRVRLRDVLQAGIQNNTPINTMATQLAGTKARGFTDGALSITRRNAETVIRTTINNTTNTSRELVWQANSDIIAGVQWVSTLDGRTSAICRSRDGKIAPILGGELKIEIPDGRRLVPPSARPPAHPNCRSVTIAILDGEGIANKQGTRPFNSSFGRKTYRQIAQERAGFGEWRNLSVAKRNALVANVRTAWQRRNIGTVPADVTYGPWLAKQSAAFQDQVLGKTKGKLFRTGKIKIDQFTTRRGDTLTLKQLAAEKPEVFREAGLSPDDF